MRTCTGPAYNGCTPPDGDHSYIETRSQKDGAAASFICTYLISGQSILTAECPQNTNFIRKCWYGGSYGHGFHSGSSNNWTVGGRVATVSDATVC